MADSSLDLLLCWEVVEHLLEPPIALAEMARILKPGGYALITTPNPNNLVERLGYAIDRLTRGYLKQLFWAGHDEISAPEMDAEAGLGHVSVYPFKTWRNWLKKAGLEVIQKVRGPMIFGGPFFDRHFFISGLTIALDPLLDRLPGRFLLSNNLGILCCKK
jgi:SAM-dependent methyltransferase